MNLTIWNILESILRNAQFIVFWSICVVFGVSMYLYAQFIHFCLLFVEILSAEVGLLIKTMSIF